MAIEVFDVTTRVFAGLVLPKVFKSVIRRFAHAARWPIRSLRDLIYPANQEINIRRIIAGAILAPFALAASIIVVVSGIVTLLAMAALTPPALVATVLFDAALTISAWVLREDKPAAVVKPDPKFTPVEMTKNDSDYGKDGSYDPRSFSNNLSEPRPPGSEQVVNSSEVPRLS